MGRINALEEAVRNLLGFLDTPIHRRRMEGNDRYSEVVAEARALLGTTDAEKPDVALGLDEQQALDVFIEAADPRDNGYGADTRRAVRAVQHAYNSGMRAAEARLRAEQEN